MNWFDKYYLGCQPVARRLYMLMVGPQTGGSKYCYRRELSNLGWYYPTSKRII